MPTKAKGETLREFIVVGRKLPSAKEHNPPIYKMQIFATNHVIAKSRFWYFTSMLRRVKKANGEILECKEYASVTCPSTWNLRSLISSLPLLLILLPNFAPSSQNSSISVTPLRFRKRPGYIKNYGIWLRYDSRTNHHNMYREYRDNTIAGAVTQCYRDMGARHRAQADRIQIIKVQVIKASDCKRAAIKQFHNSKICFPLPHRIAKRKNAAIFFLLDKNYCDQESVRCEWVTESKTYSHVCMFEISKMDCFVGASTGALKGISFKDNAFSNVNEIASLKPKQDEITCMSWASEDQTELLTAQMDKQLRLFDTTSNSYTTLLLWEMAVVQLRESKGLQCMGTYISAVESGELSISSPSGETVKELNAGNNLIVMVPNNEREGHYATGDELQLRVPIWVNDIRFIPKSQNVVTVTGKHQIRLYDPRTQRRPIKELEWAEEPLTAMSLCRNEMQIVAGNTRGDIGLFDLRNKMHMICKYRGCAGSISGIDAHQSAEYIASCSLDRFVRLHELNSKRLVKKENDNSESSEDEALWNDMKEITEKERRGSRRFMLQEDDFKEVIKKAKSWRRKRKMILRK
ncbi:60S ribosomal protein L18a [Dirofilaria immitis]|nr:60S ribosomal protein L18a [Dirofilaria immitis]